MTAPASRKFFGQSGEDLLLWAVFDGQPSGFFIDVGAFDGVHISNSYSFELEGWSGICVEAHPQYAPLCAAARPGSFVVQAACVGPGGSDTVTFMTEPLGLLSGIRLDPEPVFHTRYKRRGMSFPGFTPVTVEALTLDAILARFGGAPAIIDFLSIDTEGTEIDVLRGFSGDARVMLLEANTGPRRDELVAYMQERGYQPARAIGVNLFFARQGRDFDILASAEVSGRTETVPHPMGAQATPDGMVGKEIRIER